MGSEKVVTSRLNVSSHEPSFPSMSPIHVAGIQLLEPQLLICMWRCIRALMSCLLSFNFLFERERRRRDRGEESLPSAGPPTMCPQWLGMSEAQSRSPELDSGLPRGRQKPECLGHHLLPLGLHLQGAGLEAE